MRTASMLYIILYIVGDMVLSTQMDTYFELGGLLQYLFKSCSVEVLMFPGRFMEENGHKMEHSMK